MLPGFSFVLSGRSRDCVPPASMSAAIAAACPLFLPDNKKPASCEAGCKRLPKRYQSVINLLLVSRF